MHSNGAADQCLCFRDIHVYSTIPLLPKSELSLSIFCGCTAWFVSDLVGNPEDRFSPEAAQIMSHAFCLQEETLFFSLLSPLLAEYDTQIKELQLLVSEYEVRSVD